MSLDSTVPPAAVVVGETCSGNRNLPAYLASLLEPGPTLVVGACPLGMEVAAHRFREDRRRNSCEFETFLLGSDVARSTSLLGLAREWGLDVEFLCRDVERQAIGLPARQVANVLCLDVLEGVRDDVGVLEKLHRVLMPEGRLIVRVRAHPWVRPPDVGCTHQPRRAYEAEGLRESLDEAAFRTISLRHWNFLGVPGTFLTQRVLGRAADGDPNVSHWWDRGMDLWFKTVENRVRFPIGVSLIAVATPFFEKSSVSKPVPGGRFRARVAREAYEPLGMGR